MPADLSRGELRHRIRTACGWLGDRTDEYRYADMTGWWRSPDLLAALGPALAGLFAADRPTIVLGIESRGCLLGPLVAVALGVGSSRSARISARRRTATRGCTAPPRPTTATGT